MSKTLNKKPIYERMKQLKNKDYKYNKKLRSKGKNKNNSPEK